MKKFRISAKKLLLTYSQVHPEVTAKIILEQLQSKYQLSPDFQYVISKEYHQDGGIHFHVVISQNEKIEIHKPNTLDIQYQEQSFHGNYTPIRNIRHTVAYVCKEKEYITNFENLRDGQLLTAKQFIVSQVEEKGVDQALLDYYQRSPEKAIAGVSVSSLRKHFQDIEKIRTGLQLDQVNTPFTLENFQIPDQVKTWIQNPDKTLLLVGKSGIGKTQFCKAVAKSKNLKTLLVNHKEDFRRLNTTYGCIIVDDANLQEFEETQLLSIIDSQADKSIRVLYDNVTKKANTLQMIAMNPREFQKLASYLTQPRFARRVLIHEPKQPFMINVNINIINNNININNNYDFKAHQQQEQRHIQETQRKVFEISQRKHLD
jgi:Geminivirus Rep catalytic domain